MCQFFNLGFAPEGGGFVGELFGINYFNWFVGAGIGSAFAVFVIEEALLWVGGDAGVETAVGAEENVDEVWGH